MAFSGNVKIQFIYPHKKQTQISRKIDGQSTNLKSTLQDLASEIVQKMFGVKL